MLKQTFIYGLLALLHPVIANPANLCRVTHNYGCTKHSYNCDDLIGDEHVPTFPVNDITPCDGTKSSDDLICCDTARLNGGYCPTVEELVNYNFVPSDSGSGTHKIYQMMPGRAWVRCNQVRGPHYCFRREKIAGEFMCVDPGMYS